MKEPILVSACLLGLLTRYDGQTKRNQKVLDYLKANDCLPIPVCPEQIAGMPTPRPATQFVRGDGHDVIAERGDVQNSCGEHMNRVFLRGARESLKTAMLCGCRRALLKERSPSCGVHEIYRNGKIVKGVGVTTALLQQAGLDIISEEDLTGNDE